MNDEPDNGATVKDFLRVLRVLKLGPASPSPASRPGMVMLENGTSRKVFAEELLKTMARQGLIVMSGKQVIISQTGTSFLKRSAEQGNVSFASQHRICELRSIEDDGVTHNVTINAAESPLARLAGLKSRDGNPFLAPAEFAAGERLRSDFERASLQPSLTTNWQVMPGGKRRNGYAGKEVEMTDAVMAARQRVADALDSVGPELSGVLADVTCFLKGLEQIEVERGWPRRSAKLMLKTALALLARYYQPKTQGKRKHGVLHWGGSGYRPDAEDFWKQRAKPIG